MAFRQTQVMIEDTDDDRASGRDQRQWLRWAGPVVGTVVFLVAAVVISGELRQVSWREVEAAATAMPLTSMVLALTALVVSLGAASSFDRLALASLGRSASWRKTWQPSMLAFALANAGAPGLALAGGIRFRAYQADRLSGADVALVSALSAIVGLIGGLVLVSLAAAGALSDIAAQAHLPHWVGLLMAIFGLKILAAYLLAPRAGWLRRFPTAVLRKDGAIVAFANLWCTPDGHTVSIDLMRYGTGAPKNSMELLFIHLMQWGKAQGFKAFDMGMAPLSGLDSHRLAPSVARLGSFVYAEGGSLYGFEGLRAFKQKFNPRWDPVYIAAPTSWMLGPALADAALLSSGGLMGALR